MTPVERFSLKELNGRPLRLLIGGSPCTHWSIVRQKKIQNGDRETSASGIGWELFLNYVIAKEKFNPDFFLYENNKTAAKEIKEQIQNELGFELQYINSSLVSAQRRERFYVYNFDCPLPEDRGITLLDIIEDDVQPIIIYSPRFNEGKCRIYYDKSPTITAAGGGGHIPRLLLKGYKPEDVTVDNWRETSRELLVNEVERLQTIPVGYTNGLSKTRAFTALGNGWTAEVIIHILSYIDVLKDYPIEVLSMYDGIGTGRYCLEKLGYTNITYKAYEIDEYAKKVAIKNYPDIIQCGDAYQVREDNWEY